MVPQTPVLQTKRMRLRPLVARDATDMFEVFSDPQTCTWWTGPAHTKLSQTRETVTAAAESQTSQTWAITLDDDRALGWVYLGDRKSGVAELGFILHRSQWGKGLITEAGFAIIEYAFQTRKLRRLFADADPDNIGSQKVIEKLGFVYEGIARANWDTHLGVRDSYIYGRIATDPSPAD
jgi:RimJ/RimL family protein N-acetyltransferase